MIRAIRPSAVARADASLVTGWNIAPNVGYTVSLSVSASTVVVILASLDGATLIGSGLALVGADQSVTITPVSGQTVGMVDTDLGWHLLVTTAGTEGERSIVMDPMVDLADEIHPIYTDDGMALARATAAINAGACYVDDVSVNCPLGIGGGIGAVASAPVDGSEVVGQVESITWSGTPDGVSEAAVIRRHTPIAPEAYVPPLPPPVLVDDTAETDAATATSGNVLTNDTGALTVSAVNGLSANVGQIIGGSIGGEFVIDADGSWTFDPRGDFSELSGADTATTSVSYHATNGEAVGSAILTVTVGAAGVETDPYLASVVFLLQVSKEAIDGTTDYADAKGTVLYKCSNPLVATVSTEEKAVAFSGSNFLTMRVGDVHCSPVADTNKNGSLDMTFEFVANVTTNILYLYKLGATGSGTGTTKDYRGGLTIAVSSSNGVGVYGGNLSRDGASCYYGKQTGPVATGRREIVVRIVSNEVYVYVDGVAKQLTIVSTTYNKAENLSNSQLYVSRSVNIAAYHKYDCSNDTTLSSSFGICAATHIIAMRITRGIARDVQYPLQLPFLTQ